VPPSLAAAQSAAIATGPYSEGSLAQLRVVCRPIGSPVARSWAGVITYGLWPSSAIRP
jgi:hypothetical protein